MRLTEEQREEHKEKKKDYGLEGYEYKQKKAAEQEAQIKANEQIIDGQEDSPFYSDLQPRSQCLTLEKVDVRLVQEELLPSSNNPTCFFIHL